jgi:hypothetical protein
LRLLPGVGIGDRHDRGQRIMVTVEPMTRLAAKQRHQLERAMARLGTLFEVEAPLSVGVLG